MTDQLPSRGHAALAGAVAGAAAIGVNELLAGLLPGAPSFVVEVGAAVIALQPPGAKQLMVDLFGTNDKLVFNLLIAVVAIGGAATLGIVARRRFGWAALGFAGAGLAALGVSVLLDPLVDPALAVLSAAISVGVGIGVLGGLLRLATPHESVAEMPDWSRRRFIGTSVAVAGVAVTSGLLGRVIGEQGRVAAPPVDVPPVPEPVDPLPALSSGTDLGVEGLSPIVTPNAEFYRIDTSLLVPRLDASTWGLTVTGMVDRPLTLTYAELLAMPLHERYVTIACVSNEVGGDLVGNALWRGALLRDVLKSTGVQAGATQVVGRSFDGWTCGFPTEWVMTDERDALIAVAMNDEPLPADHGFPARLIVPGLFGYVSATKWLTNIELTTWEAFDAYWVPLGWAKDGPILTQSRIDVPRAGDTVGVGEVAVAGVAWAPDRGINGVEVQVDEGPWQPAELSVAISDATWVQWRYAWSAANGDHTLRVRATDGEGTVQESRATRPAPDGARGHHTINVTVG
ncbi:MAG TPA: molybdopterin-dependent oxidoreductase [Candidatus Limnocylindria bacterium]|nr:molybdopterin-dependent oxidoreductase [Candidatus Limnocylindria bacterium]